MSAYDTLSDEGKLLAAINFVAVGQPLPESLERFLIEQGLFDAIVNPKIIDEERYERK